MPAPVGSHSALIAMEKDGDAAGTFTDIAKVNSEGLFPELTRDMSVSIPHGDTVSSKVFGPMKLGPMQIEGDFIYDNATHDATTGLQKRYLDGDEFGMLVKGPTWSSGVDEMICSGEITAFRRTAPNDAGIYGFTCTFEPSGVFKVDGTSYGTVN